MIRQMLLRINTTPPVSASNIAWLGMRAIPMYADCLMPVPIGGAHEGAKQWHGAVCRKALSGTLPHCMERQPHRVRFIEPSPAIPRVGPAIR